MSQRRAQERERQAQFDTIRQKEQKEQKLLKSNQMTNALNNQTQKWLLNESIDLTTAIATTTIIQTLSSCDSVTSSTDQNDLLLNSEKNINNVPNDSSVRQSYNSNQRYSDPVTSNSSTSINQKDDGRFIEYNKVNITFTLHNINLE